MFSARFHHAKGGVQISLLLFPPLLDEASPAAESLQKHLAVTGRQNRHASPHLCGPQVALGSCTICTNTYQLADSRTSPHMKSQAIMRMLSALVTAARLRLQLM